MSWIDFCWPVAGGACLTMGLIHLWIGVRGVSRRANLLFALNAFVIAAYSVIELRLIHARNPAEYLARLRWLDLGAAAVGVALLSFIWVYFGTGRKWLGILGVAILSLSLTFDLRPVPQLVFREITGICMVTTFGGATYPVAEGVANPWNALFYLGILLLLLFVADASITLWQRGDRRRATVLGGTIVIFYILASVHAALVDLGIVKTPYLVTFTWLIILGAMAWELSRDLLRSAQMSEELRDAQERMQLAAEAARFGLWVWDVGRDEIWTTREGRVLFGFTETERIDRQRFFNAVHPDDRDAMRQAVAESLQTDNEYERVYRVPVAGGEPRWVSVRGRVERDAAGQAIRVRGVAIDISELHQAEAKLRQANEQIAHTARVATLGELSSALAHELNQPLGAILRNAEVAEILLKAEVPDLEELRAVIADIRQDDERAGNVIDRLRALLKRRNFELQPVDLAQLANEVVALLRFNATDRHVRLETSIPANLPVVRGDRVHLQQVLLNLIMNATHAISHTSSSDGRVVVSARQTADNLIEVAVSDSGPGISTESLKQIFEPFVTTRANGMGLGLSISRTIIEAHHGRIWAENNPDCGATFYFTLTTASTGGES